MNQTDAEREEVAGLPDGWVFVYHPDLEDSYQKVTAEAYEEVWAEKGWQKANDLVDEFGNPASSNVELPPVELTSEEEQAVLAAQEQYTGQGEANVQPEDGDESTNTPPEEE